MTYYFDIIFLKVIFKMMHHRNFAGSSVFNEYISDPMKPSVDVNISGQIHDIEQQETSDSFVLLYQNDATEESQSNLSGYTYTGSASPESCCLGMSPESVFSPGSTIGDYSNVISPGLTANGCLMEPLFISSDILNSDHMSNQPLLYKNVSHFDTIPKTDLNVNMAFMSSNYREAGSSERGRAIEALMNLQGANTDSVSQVNVAY